MPRLLDPGRGPVAAQALLLGGIFVGMAAATDSIYGGLGFSAAAMDHSDPL